jgi:dynein intermediate chain 2
MEAGMNHLEGGWPKDVIIGKETSKKRQILKMENDARYVKAVVSLSEPLEKNVKQNCALDIYEEYYKKTTFDYYSEVPAAKITAVLKDPHSPDYNRTATHISWIPTDGKKLAVAYSVLKFQSMPDGMPTDAYIWDVNNPNVPETRFVPSSPLCCIEYNPKESYTLVGGCYNGVVCK